MGTITGSYRGWDIYYSAIPRPLWTAIDKVGRKKTLYSYYSLEAIKKHIDDKMGK